MSAHIVVTNLPAAGHILPTLDRETVDPAQIREGVLEVASDGEIQARTTRMRDHVRAAGGAVAAADAVEACLAGHIS
jgi:UDP:flavonoid glycosyltransferase YjiC (YdhE family)